MPHHSPPALIAAEQRAILAATAVNVRDRITFSMALGCGLRLTELVGLNLGDVLMPDGTSRVRVRIRKEIAMGGRAADASLPDRLVAKLTQF